MVENITISSLRSYGRTPWGFISYAATVVEEGLDQARAENLRTLAFQLRNPVGINIRKPDADTTIHVTEVLVNQELNTGNDVEVSREEYDTQIWVMEGA